MGLGSHGTPGAARSRFALRQSSWGNITELQYRVKRLLVELGDSNPHSVGGGGGAGSAITNVVARGVMEDQSTLR